MHLLRIDTYVLFRLVTVFVGVQLCTVNRLLTESPVRPMLTNIQICTCFQCVPFTSMINMDCSEEGDFALLILAEEAAIP